MPLQLPVPIKIGPTQHEGCLHLLVYLALRLINMSLERWVALSRYTLRSVLDQTWMISQTPSLLYEGFPHPVEPLKVTLIGLIQLLVFSHQQFDLLAHAPDVLHVRFPATHYVPYLPQQRDGIFGVVECSKSGELF